MAAPFDDARSIRATLAAIVADPALGPQVLFSAATLTSLFADYLPDSPRETGPLIAAAQEDIPEALRFHVTRGLTPPMAIQLAAAGLAARTAFSEQACLRAASELALALGLATVDQLPDLLSPASVTTAATQPARPAPDSVTMPRLPAAAVGQAPPGSFLDGLFQSDQHPSRPGSPHRRWPWIAALAIGVVAVSGLGIALLSQHHGSVPSGPLAGTSQASTSTASASSATPAPAVSQLPAPSPARVAREYISYVDNHDWHLLWKLGGGNVVLTYQPGAGPQTYPQMVTAFQDTVLDTITSLTMAGDTASMRINALDSAGVTQHYLINLTVEDGRIISGQQYFYR